jgi:uncharacterized protein YegL
MPKFSDQENNNPIKSSFGYSAVPITALKDSEYTLVTIVVDRSGSVAPFSAEEEKTIAEIVAACRRSPRADLLLLRYVTFDTSLTEVHGFKLLQDCNAQDYAGTLTPGGMTALYDATVDGVNSITNYAKDLTSQDYSVNGILFVVTDGDNNAGLSTVGTVKKAFSDVLQSEALESFVSILIGVNVQESRIAHFLNDFSKNAGFNQYVELANADSRTLAKLAAFVSKSISSQSQALGTGGPSQALTF